MNSKPTLQTLQLDCLLEILKHVSLPECMLLRTTCRHLKAAVEEHFRSGVRTLPVLLSAKHPPEILEQFEKFIESTIQRYYEVERIYFGSGVSRMKMWERKHDTFINQKGYFRSRDYLILFDMIKFDAFVNFITKYLPNVTKLVLITDHDDYFRMIPTILNLYRKWLKVLLLDLTLRSYIEVRNKKHLSFSSEFYNSIVGLEALEELYFYTKNIYTFHRNLQDKFDGGGHRFVDSMFRKLRVLHINFDRDPEKENKIRHFEPIVFSKLEELACYSATNFYQPNASYPRLKKCIFLGELNILKPLDLEMLENLEEIHISNEWFYISSAEMQTLNSLPNLQQLHLENIVLEDGVDIYSLRPNKTIKFLKINKLSYDQFHYQNDAEEVKRCSRFFKNLEKVVILEPFMELAGNDLK